MKKNRQTNIRIGGIVQWRLKLCRSLQVRKSVTALFFAVPLLEYHLIYTILTSKSANAGEGMILRKFLPDMLVRINTYIMV